jgi:hypothetical protein
MLAVKKEKASRRQNQSNTIIKTPGPSPGSPC